MYTRGFVRTYAEYLGLNPQAILDLYSPPRTREPPPRLRSATPGISRPKQIPVVPLLVVGGAVLAILLLVYLRAQYYSFSDSIRLAEATAPSNVGASSTGTPGLTRTPEAAAAIPTATAATTPSPTPITGVLVVAHVQENTWLQVWVDGQPQMADIVPAGEEKEFHGSQSVKLRVANAGAVSVVVNGEPQPPLGSDGQVVEAVWGR